MTRRPEIDTARPISIPSNLLGFPPSSPSDKINKRNKQESVCNCRERKRERMRRNYATKPFAVLVTGSYLWQCRFIAIQLCSKVRAFWRCHGKDHAGKQKKKNNNNKKRKGIRYNSSNNNNKGETSNTLCVVHLHKTFGKTSNLDRQKEKKALRE